MTNIFPSTIYTIGHSNLALDRFIKLLESFMISSVVDVRSFPYSQYCPHFNRETLSHELNQHRFKYYFAGDFLGGRPTDPSCYKNKLVAERHADYLHLVDYPEMMKKGFFLTGIDRLLKIAQTDKVTIMCSEEDPEKCHRHHLIGKYLSTLGVDVQHIRANGTINQEQKLRDLPKEEQISQPSLFGD